MSFSPRLVKIINILLESKEPVSIKNISEVLEISKRTVSRELEKAEPLISIYNLKIETKSKKGTYISGSEINKKKLIKNLSAIQTLDNKNIIFRQKSLIFELLKNNEPQKIFYFSKLLDVSQRTVNNDLNNVENWFEKNNINLIRKPGLGVYINYSERNFRKAVMNYISKEGTNSDNELKAFVGENVISTVDSIIHSLECENIKNMTPYYQKSLRIFLSIIIYRISNNNFIENIKEVSQKEKTSQSYLLAKKIASFTNFDFPENEIKYLYIFLKSARMQKVNVNTSKEEYKILKSFVLEMINEFDPTISIELSTNTDLIDGLIAHLKPAIERIQNGVQIFNPLQREVELQYPDIYQKTKKATKVLENFLNCTIPEDEIGLLSFHFGGASVAIKNNRKYRKKIQVAVVCASGIGISTMLTSNLKHLLHNKIHIQKLSIDELQKCKNTEFDIVVSTLKLPIETIDYIQVHPMLTADDKKNIEKKIEEVYSNPTSENTYVKDTNLLTYAQEINLVTSEILSILKTFKIEYINCNSTFEEIVTHSANILCDSKTDASIIQRNLLKRESLGSQVIPEFGLVFLHSKIQTLDNVKVLILRPKEKEFTNNKIQGVNFILVVLIPENDPRTSLAISSVSYELFNDKDFLETLKTDTEEKVRNSIEKILTIHLDECINKYK